MALASTSTGRLQTQSSTTIAAGALCAAFDATAVGTTAGSAAIVASAPTAGGVEWTPDTLDVAVGQPRLRLTLPATLTPGATNVSATVEIEDQAGVTRLAAESVPLALTSSATSVVRWRSATAAIAEGASAVTVRLDALASGSAAVTVADARTGTGRYAPDTDPVTVAFAVGKLHVAGWPSGDFEDGREYRIRIYPRNADGSARASFGQTVSFRMDQEGKLEVHKDRYPAQAAGKTTGSKNGRVHDGQTVTAAAGDAYLSVIVVIKGEEASGALTIVETTGAYQAHARLRGQTDEDD